MYQGLINVPPWATKRGLPTLMHVHSPHMGRHNPLLMHAFHYRELKKKRLQILRRDQSLETARF